MRARWAANLRAARKAAGMTQMVLAAELGTTQQAIAKWESGKGTPRDETRWRIAEALGVPVYEIFEAPDNGGSAAA